VPLCPTVDESEISEFVATLVSLVLLWRAFTYPAVTDPCEFEKVIEVNICIVDTLVVGLLWYLQS
jgi:hypothetical protein